MKFGRGRRPIEAVGKDVTDLAPDDEVFGKANGAYAAFAVAKPGRLAPKPESLTFEQAAAVPASATTARQAVGEARLQAGDRVLVVGADACAGPSPPRGGSSSLTRKRGSSVEGIERNLRAQLVSPFVGQTLWGFVAKQRRQDLLVRGELIQTGAITPPVDRTYTLAEAPAAVRSMADGHVRGKVVITI